MYVKIKIGDCAERLKDLEDNSVDAVICDPPYGLKFMSKGWDDIGEGNQQREWHRAWLTEAHRVLKPNGVMKAFSGTRTFHHLIAVMEEIGFSDLKVEAWSYGSGFPKGYNIAKAVDRKLNIEQDIIGLAKGVNKASNNYATNRFKPEYKISVATSPQAKTWEGWGTALKPSWEPVCIGFKK